MMRMLLTLSLLLAFIPACGLDESYTGLGDGALPGDPLKPVEPSVQCQVECECTGGSGPADTKPQGSDVVVADLADRGYRVDSLVLTGPMTGMIADQLNNYFSEQIEADGLNILFLVKEDDREAGTLVFRLGAGTAEDGEYTFVEDAGDLACQLDGDLFQSNEPSTLVIPNDALDPPTLPINELDVIGRFDLEGSAISEGQLAGALTQADADAIKILGLPLSSFLADSEPDLDLDEDGTADAWLFEFDFTAVEAPVKEAP